MPNSWRWHLAGETLLLAVLVVGWASSRGLSEKARLFPSVILPVVGVLVLIAIGRTIWHRRAAAADDGAGSMDLLATDGFSLGDAVRSAADPFAWIAGLIAGAILMGPVITLPLFVVLHMRFSGRLGWWPSAIAGLAIAAFLIGVFEILLNTPWPPGLLPWPQEMLLRGVETTVDTLGRS